MQRLHGVRERPLPAFEKVAAGFDVRYPRPLLLEYVARMTVWGTLLLAGSAVGFAHLPSLFVGIVLGQLLHFAWQVRRRNKKRLRYVQEQISATRLLFPWTVCERHREIYSFKCPKCKAPRGEK